MIPNFLRKCHTGIQSGCISLHYYEQWKSIPFTSHPFQHRLSLAFLILAILTGIKWYFSIIMICISLIVKDIEQVFLSHLKLEEDILENRNGLVSWEKVYTTKCYVETYNP